MPSRTILVALLLIAGRPVAADPGPYFAVVAGRFAGKAPAVTAAKRLSAKLRLPLAVDTLQRPPDRLLLSGVVVSVHRQRGQLVLTAFLGVDRAEATAILRRVRRVQRDARLARWPVEPEKLDETYIAYATTAVVILGSLRSCEAALKLGARLAAQTGVPFSRRGLVCDKRRGLIWPDDFSDEMYAGSYWGRRYADCGEGETACISVERAEFYGFRKGLYILVGGLFGDDELAAALARYRRTVPGAYAKKTTLYLGCIH